MVVQEETPDIRYKILIVVATVRPILTGNLMEGQEVKAAPITILPELRAMRVAQAHQVVQGLLPLA